jgi:hypothetical protein
MCLQPFTALNGLSVGVFQVLRFLKLGLNYIQVTHVILILSRGIYGTACTKVALIMRVHSKENSLVT